MRRHGLDLCLLVGAPLAVVAGLTLGRSVWAVFAIYHVGICLILPWVRERLGSGTSWADHLRHLGLQNYLGRGILLGLGTAALVLASFFALGQGVLDREIVDGALAAWGVPVAHQKMVALFMLVVNGPAEELCWRGYLHHRLADWPARTGALAATSLGYASYHAVTVHLLIGHVAWAAAVFLGVAAAGFGWGWLREKTGSVWPALMSHLGATWAYVYIWHYLGLG